MEAHPPVDHRPATEAFQSAAATRHMWRDEGRTATRFRAEPDSSYAVIRHPRRGDFTGEVHDESLGGLGLLVGDATDLDIGQAVEITYLDSRLQATVTHIQWHGDGRHRVGFACQTLPQPTPQHP